VASEEAPLWRGRILSEIVQQPAARAAPHAPAICAAWRRTPAARPARRITL